MCEWRHFITFYTPRILTALLYELFYPIFDSACYGGKKEWDSAIVDAKECIKVDPTFIKGYYRLASAQLEKNEFDAALATIKQGMSIEPNNPQLQKQMRQIKAKRSMKRAEDKRANSPTTAPPSGMPGGMMPYGHLDSSVSKEVMDLQQQLLATTKEYRIVKANIQKSQNGKRSNELTRVELEKLPQGTEKMYRGVGKMFMLTSRSDIMNHLEESIAKEAKEEKDLSGKLDYLERRMKSQHLNIQELTKTSSAE